MEREKFEQSLKRAFDEAEVNPSDQVWTNIELDLEKAKGGDLKRRLMFYQMVAAASFVFAMVVGGIGYYSNVSEQSRASDLAVQTTEAPEVTASEKDITPSQQQVGDQTDEVINPGVISSALPTDGQDQNTANERQERAPQKNNPQATRTGMGHDKTDRPNHENDFMNGAGLLAVNDGSDLPDALDERALPPLYTPEQIELPLPLEEKGVDPVVAMLARLDRREREVRGEEENENKSGSSENLWTSIGFAAGSYNSIATATSSSPSPSGGHFNAMVAPIVDQETKASGYTYSMGVNVGTRLSERWVLQGGVNYLTQQSEYTANNVVLASTNQRTQRFLAATPGNVVHADETELATKLAYSAPYNVNNNMRYLSIPMQAGYLLINKTFGLQLNAGVATDLFLQNTVEADSYQLEKTSHSGGADSPYRTVNLSGLLGTEVSYRFGDNYRISLNPGIRYPFNTIYKSELGVQSTPLTFDVGLRFRYIFH